MSSDKLILSFPAKDDNLAFSFEELKAKGGIIRFMNGFENSLILSFGLHKTIVKDEEIRGKAPTILIYEIDSSPSSVGEELTNLHIEPSPIKLVQEPTFAVEGPSWKPTGWGDSSSSFASGSSAALPLTRTQRKNRKVRLKKKLAKEATKKAKASEKPYPLSAPQAKGNAKASFVSSSFAPLQGMEEQKERCRREFLEHQLKVFQEWEKFIRKTAS